MAQIIFLCVLSLTSLTSLIVATKTNQKSLSAYQVLQRYNFPIGLIPEGVTGYDLNEDTGEFKIYLKKSCSFPLRNSFTLSYEQTLRAVISKGRVKDMHGVSVKVLFFWFSIVEVTRISEDQLLFSVGFASSNFQMDYFVESPRCGCGMHCDDDYMPMIVSS